MRHSILCVDDEIDNVDALERLFRKKYVIHKATSGEEGLNLLEKNKVSLIISDQRMPGIDGIEFLAKTIKTHPEAIRILLTGYTDINSVVGAINSGQVYKYVTKPWDPVDLTNTIDKAIEKYDLSVELKQKNIALEKALKDLQELDEAKNHFMVLINHELKTPLTIISSFLELLNETKLTEEQKNFVSKINQSTLKLASIIEDVLKIISVEAGVMKIHRSKIDLAPFVADIKKSSSERLDEKQLKLTIKGGDFKITADRSILQQVIERILGNAIKYSNNKTSISIEIKRHSEKTEIMISNYGRPLDEKTIEKILKPFSIDENILNHSQGMGLGLSLCQALLKTHDSCLKIKSEGPKVDVSFFI